MDVLTIANAAEDVLTPIPDRLPAIDRASLVLGWAGVTSSFLLHAQRAAERYGVSDTAILLEAGRRKAVSGQEDMLTDIAVDLAAGR